MLELKFKKPEYEEGTCSTHEFREGKNTTIRKGTEWDIKPKGQSDKGTSSLVRLVDADSGEKLGIGFILETYTKQFDKLKSVDVLHEHDSNLMDLDKLYKRMVFLYRSFNKKSWVTIVVFRFEHDKQIVEQE